MKEEAGKNKNNRVYINQGARASAGRRPRSVLREIRRQQRDPYRVRLKPTAPRSRDPDQLPLPEPPMRSPFPAVPPWPERQIDLEEFIATLPPKESSR